MKKLFIRRVLFAFLSLILVCMGINIYNQTTSRNRVLKERQHLPPFSFTTITRERFTQENLSKNQPVLLLYVQADCSFCERELASILEEIDQFGDTPILLVSAMPYADKDLKKMQIHPNIVPLQTTELAFKEWFGSTATPSIFIYDAQHQLKKFFKGETKVSAIIAHL